MARATRSSLLETRTARLKLEHEKRHTQSIDQGLKLVYRRGPTGGRWYAKLRQSDGRYVLNALGTADDYQDANGADVLSYYQAQASARDVSDRAKQTGGITKKPMTVAEVMALYLDWFRGCRQNQL